MLILNCPNCGVSGEETEFHPGGEAHLTRFGPGSGFMLPAVPLRLKCSALIQRKPLSHLRN